MVSLIGGRGNFRMRSCRRCAQSLIEYVTLISIVTMALTVLFPLVKRAVQSVAKTGADLVGNQPSADHPGSGYTSTTTTKTSMDSTQTTSQGSGKVTIRDDETSGTHSTTYTQIK